MVSETFPSGDFPGLFPEEGEYERKPAKKVSKRPHTDAPIRTTRGSRVLRGSPNFPGRAGRGRDPLSTRY